MKEYSQEPLEAVGSCIRTKRTADGGGIFVADCYRKWEEPVEFAFDGTAAEAYASRLAQCFNDCLGIADPAAEIAKLRAEREAVLTRLKALEEIATAVEADIDCGRPLEYNVEHLRDELMRARAALAEKGD